MCVVTLLCLWRGARRDEAQGIAAPYLMPYLYLYLSVWFCGYAHNPTLYLFLDTMCVTH